MAKKKRVGRKYREDHIHPPKPYKVGLLSETLGKAKDVILKSKELTKTKEETYEYSQFEKNIGELRKGVLIDRKEELKALKEGLDNALNREGGCYILKGEAGVGKTRIVMELYREIENKRKEGKKIRFLSGRCIYHEAADPYLPFVDALRQYFNISKKDGGELEEHKIMETIKRASPELIGAVPIIGGLLACGASIWKERKEVREKIEAEKKIDYNQEQYRMFEAISQLVDGISEKETLVIFLDDLHWADDSSLGMLQYLVRKTRNSNVLFVGSYRPEDLDDSKGVHGLTETLRRMSREDLYKTVQVGRLKKEDTGLLVKSITKSKEIREDFLEWIYNRTDGNSVYVEAILKDIRESDSISFKDDNWYEKIDFESIPEKIEDIINRRIERLDENMQEILKHAAVYDKSFTFEELLRGTGIGELELANYLEKLMKTGTIIKDPAEDYGLKFDQEIVREKIYSQIPFFKTPILHKIAGEAIEETNKHDLGSVYTELAHHFSIAKMPEKTIEYSMKAAEQAMEKYSAPEEAHRHLKTALELLSKEDSPEIIKQKIEVLNNLGVIEDYKGNRDKALEYYDTIIEISDNELEQTKAKREKGEIFIDKGEIDTAREIFEENIGKLEGREENEYKMEVGRNYRGLGEAYYKVSEFDNSIDNNKKALEIFDGINEKIEIGKTNIDIARALNEKAEEDDYDRALEIYKDTIPLFEESKEIGSLEKKSILAKLNNNIAIVYQNKKNLERAYDHYEKARKFSEEIFYIKGMMYSTINIGGVLTELADKAMKDGEEKEAERLFEESEKELQHGLELAESNEKEYGISLACRHLGDLYGYKREWDKAEFYFKKGLNISQKLGEKFYTGVTYEYRGRVFNRKGDKDNAIKNLEEAKKIYEITKSIGRLEICETLIDDIKMKK